MLVSACLIVQDEEQLLPRCLESLKGVDEIIIVDGGSKDKTKEIAAKYTDKIFDYPWHDSFCDSRNEALKHATGDWILSIDADEYLHDFPKVREAIHLAELQEALAVDVWMIAEDNLKQMFRFPRLFKRDPRVWWEGDIHNHISVPGVEVGDVRITHGYSPAHERDPDRAFRILKKSIEKKPEAVREMFYLGREYFYRNNFEEAVKTLGKYVQRSRHLAEKAEAFLIMSRAYWAMKMPDDARDAIAQALIINANFKEAILWMADLSWEHNSVQWRKMAETANNRDVLFIRT